jgi:hypothetical protein
MQTDPTETVESRPRFLVRASLLLALLATIAVCAVIASTDSRADVDFFLHAYMSVPASSVLQSDFERPQLAIINRSGRQISVTNVVVEIKRGDQWQPFEPQHRRRGPWRLKPEGRAVIPAELPPGRLTWRARSVCITAAGPAATRANVWLQKFGFTFRFGFRAHTFVTQEYST